VKMSGHNTVGKKHDLSKNACFTQGTENLVAVSFGNRQSRLGEMGSEEEDSVGDKPPAQARHARIVAQVPQAQSVSEGFAAAGGELT